MEIMYSGNENIEAKHKFTFMILIAGDSIVLYGIKVGHSNGYPGRIFNYYNKYYKRYS